MKGKLAVLIIILFTSCLNDDFVSPQKQLQKDIATIDAYLAGVTLQSGEILIKDAGTGLRLIISEVGTAGLPPNEWNKLTIGYIVKNLANGFQYQKNPDFSTTLSSGLILGWKLGIPLLPAGSKAKLFIPSGLAYGPSGNGSIPGNANLVFDIDLKSVEFSNQQNEQNALDATTINNYLTTNSITTTDHPSGIKYIITNEGTGNSPTWYDKVKVTYSARLLNSQTPFLTETVEPSEGFSSRLVNYRLGLQIAMQLLKPGGKGTFYVPSDLAYGLYSYSNVPANSIVVFEVELIEVTQ